MSLAFALKLETFFCLFTKQKDEIKISLIKTTPFRHFKFTPKQSQRMQHTE